MQSTDVMCSFWQFAAMFSCTTMLLPCMHFLKGLHAEAAEDLMHICTAEKERMEATSTTLEQVHIPDPRRLNDMASYVHSNTGLC